MQYRSFEDLHRTIVRNLHKVPSDLDLIIGIPRSGLTVANILTLHLPVTDVNRFLDGKTISSGER
jgi:hypoxanthine phosphoribosyltransferase